MDCHCHPTPPAPPGSGPPGEPDEMTAAHKSLSDALHVSFRLLGVAMVLIVVLWLTLTGMSCVDTSERAVRVVLGDITGEGDARVHGDGLLWNWPEPFGKVVRVSIKEKTLKRNDFFWMHVPGDQVHLSVDQLRPRGMGLTPGQDGALLTADRGLIHIKVVCAYLTGCTNDRPTPQAVIDYVTNVKNEEDAESLVGSAVSAAAIRVASGMTVEYIKNRKGRFAEAVQAQAQRELDRIRSGIALQRVEIPAITEPLAARPAFRDLERAIQEFQSKRSDAEKAAITKLNAAAGESWPLLVGDLDVLDTVADPSGLSQDVRKQRADLFDAYDRAHRSGDRDRLGDLERQIARLGLLNLYAQAREDGDGKLAVRVLEQINRVLVSNRTGGAAGRKINQARQYAVRVSKTAEARAEQFRKLLPSLQATPDLTVQRLWADAKTEILTNPKMQKFYVPRSQGFVLLLSEDPDVKREIDLRKIRDKQARRKDQAR